jgi:hypothetical protein
MRRLRGESVVFTERFYVSLTFFIHRVAASIPHFVAMEVGAIDTLGRLRFFTTSGHGALIAVFRVKTVIYVAPKIGGSMKPRANPNKDAVVKPFGTIVAGGSAGIRSHIVVAIGTLRSDSYVDADLCLRRGGSQSEADSDDGS